jgi:error-prone DNA polymerase
MDERLLELALIEEEYLRINIFTHPLAPFRKELEELGVIKSKDLASLKGGSNVKVAGRVVLVHTPPTKSGIRIMFITIEDEYGLIDLTLLPEAQKRYSRTLLLNSLCYFEGTLRKYGKRSISITIERIIPLGEILSGIIETKKDLG